MPGCAGLTTLSGPAEVFAPNKKKYWSWLTIVFVLTATAWQLHHQGRAWWCSCGRAFLWTSNAWSSLTSQTFLDPYSFTHILHGLIFCGLLALLIRGLSTKWRFCIMGCALGFMIARKLGWRWSLIVFLATEAILLIWIRDSLLLEIIMLLSPINAIKVWQMGH